MSQCVLAPLQTPCVRSLAAEIRGILDSIAPEIDEFLDDHEPGSAFRFLAGAPIAACLALSDVWRNTDVHLADLRAELGPTEIQLAELIVSMYAGIADQEWSPWVPV